MRYSVDQKVITLLLREDTPLLEGIYSGIQLGLAEDMVERITARVLRSGNQEAINAGIEKTRDMVRVYLGVGE